MNLTLNEVELLLDSIVDHANQSQRVITILCPSYCYLDKVRHACIEKDANVVICAQNISQYENGAYTGDISAKMVKSCGASHVLLGHSERRHLFNETNDMIKQKLEQCRSNDLVPILCVGETDEQHEQNQTNEVIKRQLSVDGYSGEFIIAYEPVWAIGTGKTASPDRAQAVHHMIRNIIGDNYSILYGDQLNLQILVGYYR